MAPDTAPPELSTILVVDDERLMLRLLEKFFSKHGYHVLTASDGEQALSVYRRWKQDIVLVMLDLRIPGVAGEEVLHRMKDENPDVKVVMASGFLEPEMRAVMAVTGVKRFVDKPYVLEELLVIFQSVIDGE